MFKLLTLIGVTDVRNTILERTKKKKRKATTTLK